MIVICLTSQVYSRMLRVQLKSNQSHCPYSTVVIRMQRVINKHLIDPMTFFGLLSVTLQSSRTAAGATGRLGPRARSPAAPVSSPVSASVTHPRPSWGARTAREKADRLRSARSHPAPVSPTSKSHLCALNLGSPQWLKEFYCFHMGQLRDPPH